MLSEWSFVIALCTLAASVFVTRIAGIILMAWIPSNPKVERFLEGLAVSVIAALVASSLVTADIRTIIATGMAIIMMALTRNIIHAMLCGMLSAAAYPLLVSF